MPSLGIPELVILSVVCAVPILIIALIVVVVRASRKSSATKTKLCPYCKSQIHADAIVCKYCTRTIEPEAESSSSNA